MMKVQPPNEPAKCSYPALVKVAALVATSCVLASCQQPDLGPVSPTGGVIRVEQK